MEVPSRGPEVTAADDEEFLPLIFFTARDRLLIYNTMYPPPFLPDSCGRDTVVEKKRNSEPRRFRR
jgi:hypothetical protein